MSRLAYRPEIDGLRALAVLSVVLFHTDLHVPGGYVGVDIFFVISGFLITSLISAEIAAGTFSLRNFWERRIRRIMPAAAVAVLGSLIAGYFILLPAHFEELGRSAIAQAVAAANIFFYRESGYFSTAAESKPLLHFWSLAVEEQFYLLFPLLLLFLRRLSANWAWGIVAVISAVSFGASVIGVERFPDATFYLLPTRTWELALGSLLALRGGRLPLPAWSREATGWIGLGLMVVPMFMYDSRTPFPGLGALPPCLGAALVIGTTSESAGMLKRILSYRAFVFVGLLSYSLYLWHWPMIVYSNYWNMAYYSPLSTKVFVVFGSFLLAWLSWRFVEIPFRSKQKSTPNRVVSGALIATGFAAVLGLFIARLDGLPQRFPPTVTQYSAAYDDHPEMSEADLTIEAAEAGNLIPLNSDTQNTTAPSILLWGDSHARVASIGLEKMCRETGVKGYRASRSATAGLLNYGTNDTKRYNQAVFRWIETNKPTWVILVSRWEVILTGKEAEKRLQETVAKIQALGVNVSVMRQVATQRRDIPRALVHAVRSGGNVNEVGVLIANHEKYTRPSNAVIDRVAQSTPHLRVLDPIPFLSSKGRCLAEDSGQALYYDNQHLTSHGSKFLTPMFAALFTAANGSQSGIVQSGLAN